MRTKLFLSPLLGLALLTLGGCASTMVNKSTRHTDSGTTKVIEASLEASDKVKARKVEVQTREGVVYLTGVVDTEEARREAGRLAWRTEGVDGVVNDLTVGGSHFLPEMIVLAKREKLKVIEIPVNYRGRVGESKITGNLKGTLRTGFRMIGLVLRYKFAPRTRP